MDASPPKMHMAIGDSGLKAYGGYLDEEFLRELKGERGRRIYREMASNDPTVRAVLFAITSLVGALEWSFKAVDDSDEADEAKKFAEQLLEDMHSPMADVMSEACTCFTYGFAPCEMTFKQRAGKEHEDPRARSKFDDGKIGIADIALRAQNTVLRWELSPQGDVLGIWQQATWKNTVFIPLDKLALFRTSSVKNNPEGESILRGLYRPWYLKTRMEEIEAIGVERDLAGLPVLSIPNQYFDPNASDEDKAFFAFAQRLVKQIRRESREGIVLPSDMWESAQGGTTGIRKVELRLLNSGGGRTFNTTEIIDRYDRKIATAVLMDFLFLGQQAVGSFALSSDKTALFARALGAYVKRFAEVWNRQIIARVWELNGLDPMLQPTLEPGDLESPDLGDLGGFLATLAQAGLQVFGDRESENWARKLAGMPLAPEEGMGDQGAPGEDDWQLANDPAAESPASHADDMERAAQAAKRLKLMLGGGDAKPKPKAA